MDVPNLRENFTGNSKGQIISKGHFHFGLLEFFQKTNERILHSTKNEFEFEDIKSPFEII